MASPEPASASSRNTDRDLASIAEARALARRARQAQSQIAELSQERIDAIMPRIDEMMGGGMITLEKVTVIRYSHDPRKHST